MLWIEACDSAQVQRARVYTMCLDQGSVNVLFFDAPNTLDCGCRLHNPVGGQLLDYCVAVSISVEGELTCESGVTNKTGKYRFKVLCIAA